MVNVQDDLKIEISAPGLRLADFTHVAASAALHADSWRRHYRGAYSDL